MSCVVCLEAFGHFEFVQEIFGCKEVLSISFVKYFELKNYIVKVLFEEIGNWDKVELYSCNFVQRSVIIFHVFDELEAADIDAKIQTRGLNGFKHHVLNKGLLEL